MDTEEIDETPKTSYVPFAGLPYDEITYKNRYLHHWEKLTRFAAERGSTNALRLAVSQLALLETRLIQIDIILDCLKRDREE